MLPDRNNVLKALRDYLRRSLAYDLAIRQLGNIPLNESFPQCLHVGRLDLVFQYDHSRTSYAMQ
jgi:hypothetical protein